MIHQRRRNRAGLDRDGNDGLAVGLSKVDFVLDGAAADRVRAEQHEERLGLSDGALDLIIPGLTRIQIAGVDPDRVSARLQVRHESLGDFGIAAAVADVEIAHVVGFLA